MDVLLTHAYFLEEDPLERVVMKPYPPLGLLYISSHLKAQGFDVEVMDATFSNRRDFEQHLTDRRPPVIGIYVTLMTRQNALWAIQIAKHIGARVVLGGPEPINYCEEYLTQGADVIVAGEGETALEKLIPLLRDGHMQALGSIPGIAYRNENNKIQHTAPGTQIRDLDAQPFPDREAIDLGKYLDTWQAHHGKRTVSLVTARGCPYTCKWCSHSVYGFSHRRRSPQNVADEVELIRDRYDPDEVWYADDVFTISKPWLESYAAELARRDIRIPFETITREDRLDERTVKTLASMGCYRIWIGAESGSQRILDAMSRRTDVARLRQMIQLLQRHGIRAGTFIMVGYDGETWRDIDETSRHLNAALPDDLLTTLSYPIKGTPYFEQVKDRIVALRPWDEGSDRDYTVAGRYSRRFYLHAQRWLRYELNVAQERSKPKPSLRTLMRNLVRAKSNRAAMYLTRHQVERG